MIKVRAVVFDLSGNALEWLDINGEEEYLELCEIITTEPDSPIAIWDIMNYDNWDILLVFENGIRSKIDEILKKCNIPDERVIYPFDLEGSMVDNIGLAGLIFKENIRRLLTYLSYRRNDEKYSLASVEELSYINVSTDNVILPFMYGNKCNWAKSEMEMFYQLSNRYFLFNEEQDIFCDVGANIGTTCIYFKKKLDDSVKILAFEPSRENYKLLKINSQINDIDTNTNFFIPYGVSDKESEGKISYDSKNPGGSSLTNDEVNETESVRLVALDDYLEEIDISAHRIKYIWIDVEGHEARFLKGARNTLREINVPIFMEFIPRFYLDIEGEFELLMNELEYNYSYFIAVQELQRGKQPIKELWNRRYDNNLEMDIFLLKDTDQL